MPKRRAFALAQIHQLKAAIEGSRLTAAQQLTLPPDPDEKLVFLAHAAAWSDTQPAWVVGSAVVTLLEQLLDAIEELQSMEEVALTLAKEKGARRRQASASGKAGGDARHSAPGGARDKKAIALEAWAKRGPSDTKDKVAERVSIEHGWPFSTTRDYLRNALK